MADSRPTLDLFRCDYQVLWDLAATVDRDPATAFEAVGLILQPPDQLCHGGYDATPAGALTFAGTGGDGVHFSAVGVAGGTIVVMTVPMMFDVPNVVVGRDLEDFLALGCRYGYFGLEGLAYRLEATADEIVRADAPAPAAELALLTEHFALQPWPNVLGHLAELDRMLPA